MNGNESAYPNSGPELERAWGREYSGLSKRELFAAMAMQGILTHGNLGEWSDHFERGVRVDQRKLTNIKASALASLEIADALLDALAKPKDPLDPMSHDGHWQREDGSTISK